MEVSSAFACLAGAAAFTVVAPGRPPWPRASLWLSVLLLPLPFAVPPAPLAQAGLAFLVVGLIFAGLENVVGPRPARRVERLVQLLMLPLMVDSRRTAPCARGFDSGAAARLLAALAVVAVSLYAWAVAGALAPPWRIVVRVVAAAVATLALAEGMTGLARLVATAFGVRWVPPNFEQPYRSRSVGEFWNRRWNRLVADWLRRHYFRRLAVHGAQRALWATFGVSAAMHAYLLLAIDAWAALSFAAFFLLQPLLILAENRLRVARWPVVWGRAWTAAGLTLLFPLLLWPGCLLLGVAP